MLFVSAGTAASQVLGLSPGLGPLLHVTPPLILFPVCLQLLYQ